MVTQRLLIISSLCFFLAGCAGLYESQPPAPVYPNQARRYIPPAPVPSRPAMPAPPAKTPPPVVKTQPLKEFNQALVPFQTLPQQVMPAPGIPDGTVPQPPFPETDTPSYTAPESGQPIIRPEYEAVELTPFQPIEPAASLSPAVGALIVAANENTQKGNVDTAAASIDRALKIEPRNPALYYKLALIRLKQSKPQEAENLAKKSALLAAGDRQLKKHSWLLIAHAREMQKDFKGAREARAKAEGF